MTRAKKEVLKEIINRIHAGEDPEVVKKGFTQFLKDTTAMELSQAEEELIKDGMPQEEVHRLCEIHLEVFKESLEGQTTFAPQGHPVNMLMEEHRILLATAEELYVILTSLDFENIDSVKSRIPRIRHLVRHFKDSENHYLREENVLFPYLEKHGVTQPPAIMWMEHDQIRDTEKQLYEAVPDDDDKLIDQLGQIKKAATALNELLSSHFYKENNILFPTSLNVIEDSEWASIREGFNEIGYCFFSPPPDMIAKKEAAEEIPKIEVEDSMAFETGSLPKAALEAILNTLPVDITFVDDEDRVRYFSQSNERIFVRSKAIIGRQVQLCHPQKSMHVVNQILDNFRNNQRDSAEFWINLKGRLIYIRYFAVRDQNEKYLGCLEVTQDITGIQKIKGEKRLMNDAS